MRIPSLLLASVATLLVAAACGRDGQPQGASPFGDLFEITPEELERARRDPSWKAVVTLDTTALADTVSVADSLAARERWEDITPERANTSPMHLPLTGEVEGPSVLRVQVLLDRALLSPGMIDGRWGANTEKAIYWLQRREGLRATARVDSLTFAKLAELAGNPPEIVRRHRLTVADVSGPFLELPEDPYARAALECQCYESPLEKLSERFHVTPELLAHLNPGVDLDAVRAGTEIHVPAVRDSLAMPTPPIARLVVSDRGRYLHAVDAQGRVLLHFPSTLGSQYHPSPAGHFVVESITEDPWWHYQPSILAGKDPTDPEAHLPPGPNSAVGVVWMALSEPHYGIHGTHAPESIGYVTSSGCVRLTNWDARFLARRLAVGTPVEFRDQREPAPVAE